MHQTELRRRLDAIPTIFSGKTYLRKAVLFIVYSCNQLTLQPFSVVFCWTFPDWFLRVIFHFVSLFSVIIASRHLNCSTVLKLYWSIFKEDRCVVSVPHHHRVLIVWPSSTCRPIFDGAFSSRLNNNLNSFHGSPSWSLISICSSCIFFPEILNFFFTFHAGFFVGKIHNILGFTTFPYPPRSSKIYS